MGTQLFLLGPKKLEFINYEEPALGPNEVRVKTLFSGISSGTEMNLYRTYKGSQPRRFGYEQVGEVVEVGNEVKGVKVGDIVATNLGGHRNTAVLKEDLAKASLFPKEIPPIVGVFRVLAGVALTGVSNALINPGDSVVIFGQGVAGLFATQFAKLSGADPLIAVDLFEKRLKLAKEYGADFVLNPHEVDVAKEVYEITGGIGADCVIEASGSYKALNMAIDSCVRSGRVVVLSWYGDRAASDLYLGQSFHQRRIQLISSRGEPIPVLGYRAPKSIVKFLVKRKLRTDGMITHKFRFEEARKAFDLIDTCPEETIQVVLTFS